MSETMSHIQNWKPLETVMKKRGDISECALYMFMGTRSIGGKSKHLYKNKNSRRYLTLDDDCKFYVGDEEVTEATAFYHVDN